MDNRERIQTSRKCFERENRHWPYQRSSTYSAILCFPVESTEKGLRVFHDPYQNFPEILIRINFEDGNVCFVSEETSGKKLKTSDQTLLSTLLAV